MTYEDVTVRESIKTDSRGQQFVLGVGETVDELTASGEWIASDTTAEIEQ